MLAIDQLSFRLTGHKKDREGGKRPNKTMATCNGLQKREGKWQWHQLAINWSMNQLTTQKGERRPLAINWLSFGSTGHKKDREGGERSNETMAACDSFQKKRRQEASGDGACLQSIGLWINWLHKREKEGHLQSNNHLLDWLATKKDREGGERPNKTMATCNGLKRQEASGKWKWHLLAIDQSTDQLATQQWDRRLLTIDWSSFGLTGGEMEVPNEKGKKQVAMRATCNDWIFNW